MFHIQTSPYFYQKSIINILKYFAHVKQCSNNCIEIVYRRRKFMLNDRIKELRQARHMTQVELAKALGLTKQCVSNWENDNVAPSVEMLVKIADYFCVSTDYLLGRDESYNLNVSDLTTEEIVHIQQLINDLKNR
mgnify:CR=1 FL=1